PFQIRHGTVIGRRWPQGKWFLLFASRISRANDVGTFIAARRLRLGLERIPHAAMSSLSEPTPTAAGARDELLLRRHLALPHFRRAFPLDRPRARYSRRPAAAAAPAPATTALPLSCAGASRYASAASRAVT